MNLEPFNVRIANYYLNIKDYYLGLQLSFDSDCHMFIDYNSKQDTGRGNIEVFEDQTIAWYYTIKTNTTQQTYIRDLKKTPEWFQNIYYATVKIKREKHKKAKSA